MRRRDFIAGLGGVAAWPLAARAQQPDRMRRISVLMAFDESDSDANADLSAFKKGLAELGWADGHNLRMDVRWGAGDVGRIRMLAKELVELQPDLILANTTPVTAALHHETQTIPIVFVVVADPVGDGFVASLPAPGGNITGFISQEAGLAGKWLELLTEIAPDIKRAAFMFNPDNAARGGSYFLPSFQAAAQLLKIESIPAPIHTDAEIEGVVASLGREPRGGLVVPADGFVMVHRARIISLAARNRVPAVYFNAVFARDGGLLSYGVDFADIFYRAARYVDRILRGARPAELPVQAPIKFQMALNAKTASTLGLTVPPTILISADEVIE